MRPQKRIYEGVNYIPETVFLKCSLKSGIVVTKRCHARRVLPQSPPSKGLQISSFVAHQLLRTKNIVHQLV